MSQMSNEQVSILVSLIVFVMMVLVGGIVRIELEKRKRKRAEKSSHKHFG